MKIPKLFRPGLASTTSQRSQPIETGTVRWLRSIDESLAAARNTTKPVFALFQEVPGCAGCRQFGADVLSDPRVVDAIETNFVPLLIHNNAPGPDAEVLAAYNEPAWNYQVVRFLDANGADLIDRRDRVWTTGPLAARMIRALEVARQPVPAFLQLTEQEHSERLRTAFFAHPCFWVGEFELGQIDGVVTTQAGFMDDFEVTKVTFDPSAITLDELVSAAQARDVANRVFVDDDARFSTVMKFRIAPTSDQKRQLRSSARRVADLSNAQLTKLNAFVHQPAVANQYLAPSQR